MYVMQTLAQSFENLSVLILSSRRKNGVSFYSNWTPVDSYFTTVTLISHRTELEQNEIYSLDIYFALKTGEVYEIDLGGENGRALISYFAAYADTVHTRAPMLQHARCTCFVRTWCGTTDTLQTRRREDERHSRETIAWRLCVSHRRDAAPGCRVSRDRILSFDTRYPRLLDRVTPHVWHYIPGVLRARACCARNPAFRCTGQWSRARWCRMYHVCAKDLFYIQDFSREDKKLLFVRSFFDEVERYADARSPYCRAFLRASRRLVRESRKRAKVGRQLLMCVRVCTYVCIHNR